MPTSRSAPQSWQGRPSDGGVGGRCHGGAHRHGPAAHPRSAATKLGDRTQPRHGSSARGVVAGRPASCAHPSRRSLGVLPAGTLRPTQPAAGRKPGGSRDLGPIAVPATGRAAQSVVGRCRSAWSTGVFQLLDTARHGGGSDRRSGPDGPRSGNWGARRVVCRAESTVGSASQQSPVRTCTMIFCRIRTRRARW